MASVEQGDQTLLSRTVDQLNGVGAKVADNLARLNLFTFEDLLFHLPLRYEDRTKISLVKDLVPFDRVLLEGVIDSTAIIGSKRRSLVCRMSDVSGAITLRFFHFTAKQREALAQPGVKIRCFGEVRSGFRSGFEMAHPEYRLGEYTHDLALSDRLTPIYPTTKGLSQRMLRKLINQVLFLVGQDPIEELLPEAILKKLSYTKDLNCALHYLHGPPADADVEMLQSGQHPAAQRLAFEELLAHQLSLGKLRLQERRHQALSLVDQSGQVECLFHALPFSLTAAQRRVWQEIKGDIEQSTPMLRLVQGDVGSGKTVLAAAAVLQAVSTGHQAVVMAPTELLAEQHLRNFQQWLEPLGVRVGFLTGSLKASARKDLLASLLDESIKVVVGTHALFQKDVVFHSLALLVVDEQHRFGVHQRLSLMNKGAHDKVRPHQLIMTATPIPRTLAMSAYGDLDCSIIDELPPGRKPIKTLLASQSRRDEVVVKLREHCLAGKQAYWVCTLVEESEVLQAQAAQVTATALMQMLPDLKIGLVHGRFSANEKAPVMQAFARQELDVLIATTVVEVGVDVPNASLMVIDNPERLGLAQLHQLRGRVGRGEQASFCVLLYDTPLSYTAKQRLEIMRRSQDGFYIAEQDLLMRGPGEVLGVRQSGLVDFKIADLNRDARLVEHAVSLSPQLVSTQPNRVDRLIERWLKNKKSFAAV